MTERINKNSKTVLCAVNSKYVHTNLAVRSIYAYAKNKTPELNISIFETTINDSISNTLSCLYEQNADVYGFSCYLWNISYIKELASSLKKAFTGKKDIIIFFGGPEVSFDSEVVLKTCPYVDFVVSGEGEYTVSRLLNGEDFSCIDGITYRYNDSIQTNPQSKVPVDLDSLPFVYGEEIDILKSRLIYYETSRGCPFKCAYCLSGSDNKVRYLSLDRVKEDFMFFINHEVPLVKLVDRTFNASPARSKEIINFICENSKNTRFHMEISADILDDELISILNSAPKDIMQFEIGVQSTNIKTLDAINRKSDFEKLKLKVKKLLQGENIHIHLDLIAGLPHEDFESFKKSFNDVMDIKPHMLQLGFLKLLKGSKLRCDADIWGMQYADGSPYEIICNRFISFDELSCLKRVEFVLDRLYNSGDFKNTLELLFNVYNNDYFKLFEDIADYFKKMGHFNVSLSKYQIYDIVYEMFSGLGVQFKDAITYDYLLNVTSHARPDWIDFVPSKDFTDACFEILKNEELKSQIMPWYKDVPAKKIIKSVYFYKFSDKILMFDRSKNKAIDVTAYFV